MSTFPLALVSEEALLLECGENKVQESLRYLKAWPTREGDSWILRVTTGCDQCLSEIYVVGPWKTSQFKMATSASLKTPELLSFNNLCYVCYKCDLSIHGVLGQDRRVLRQSFVIWEPCSLWVDSVLQIKISPAKASSNRADPVRYLPLGRQSLPLAKSTLWVSAQAFATLPHLSEESVCNSSS